MIKEASKTVPGTSGKNKKRCGRIIACILHTLVLIVILILCGFYAYYQLNNSSSATITVSSVFASSGQNPDGTPFSVMEVLNDKVIESAVEKLDGKLSVEELRSHLSVSDTQTGYSYQKLEQSLFNGEIQNNYFPTEYRLTYSTISAKIREEGLSAQIESFIESFSLPSKEEILEAVLTSYRDYYRERYLSYDLLFEPDWSAADELDYYNRYEFMKDTIQRLIRFLQFKNANTLSLDNKNGLTKYSDMINELTNGPLKGIEGYQAYVTRNGVTQNAAKLLRQFSYMQKLKEEENLRKTKEYDIIREAIELYDSTTTRVVFIPALDDSRLFYMNRTKVGLDYLTDKADLAKVQASDAEYSAKYYAYLQTLFGETSTKSKNKKAVTILRNTDEQRAHADSLYLTLKEDIIRLTNEAKLLTAEAGQTYREEISVGVPFRSAGIINAALCSVKGFVVLFAIAYVLIFITTAIFSGKKKENGEVK